ncbi:MAG: hypothetical protein JXA09_08215 [Anaerolineae bacterium]|nr:hypothetical protein [Anaerolineae bacterium]
MPRLHTPRTLALTVTLVLTILPLACLPRPTGAPPAAQPTTGAGPLATTQAPPAAPSANGLRLGERVALAEATVDANGGTITVDAPGDPLDGLQIVVPQGAYTQTQPIRVSARAIEAHERGETFAPVSPLITLDSGDGYAEAPVQLKVPVDAPADAFVMAFFVEPATGALDGLPLVDRDERSVTVAARRGGDLVLTATDYARLDALDKETKFNPEDDSWHLRNYGSYISPRGFCGGLSLTALWYFIEEKPVTGQKLRGLMDNNLGPEGKTPNFWQDDDTAMRLVSVAQSFVGAPIEDRKYVVRDANLNDHQRTFYSLAYALEQSGQPQLLAVYRSGSSGGHGLICYKKMGHDLYIVDPNYPGMEQTLVYDGTKFAKYTSAGNIWAWAEGERFIYDQFTYIGRTSYANWNLLGRLWIDAQSDTIGRFPVGSPAGDPALIGRLRAEAPTYFPAYTLLAVERDPQGLESESPLDPTAEFETDQSQLTFRIEAPPQFEGKRLDLRLKIYRTEDLGVTLDQPVKLKPGANTLGFLVEGCTATSCSESDKAWKWAGFDWIVVHCADSWDGNWYGPLCGGGEDMPYRWTVSLLQDSETTVVGTVNFHDCPNGGQAVYHVTGTIPTEGETISLQGTLISAWGKMEDGAPQSQRFAFRRDGAPAPNLAN